MARTFVQPGDIVDHVAAGTISTDDVVAIGDCVGVALGAAAAGETVSLMVTGSHDLPKVGGTAWDQGDKLDWDASEGAFGKGITPASGDVIGCAFAAKAAGSADTVGQVTLRNPGAAEA